LKPATPNKDNGNIFMKIFTVRALSCCLLFLGTMPQALLAFDQNDLEALLQTKRCIECDLTGVNLANADLSRAALTGSNLENANLSNAVLILADLARTNLKKANLANAQLSGADLFKADLQDAVLTDAKFDGAYLVGTILESGQPLSTEKELTEFVSRYRNAPDSPEAAEKIDDPRQTSAMLWAPGSFNSSPAISTVPTHQPAENAPPAGEPPVISLEESTAELPPTEPALSDLEKLLKTNRCVGCTLTGIDLSGKKLKKAYLERADLSGANLSDANLEGANFKGAKLKGANLEKANLEDTDFYKADLTGANFRKADLENAALEGALLTDAIFDGADMDGVTR